MKNTTSDIHYTSDGHYCSSEIIEVCPGKVMACFVLPLVRISVTVVSVIYSCVHESDNGKLSLEFSIPHTLYPPNRDYLIMERNVYCHPHSGCGSVYS